MGRVLVQWLTVGLLAGCQIGSESASPCLQPPIYEGEALARVGDYAITVDGVAAMIERLGSAVQRKLVDPQELRQFVEDQIRFELLARAAYERGFANDPEVVEAARKIMVRRLLLTDLGAQAFPDDVADDEIASYYQRHVDEYRQPAKRRILHVQLVPTPEGKALAASLIARAQARVDDKLYLRGLVAQHSTDEATRQAGGELLFSSEGELSEAFGATFARVVFEAQVDALIGEPVQSTRGWHLVKVLAERQALARDFEEVRDDIRERLLKTRRSKAFDGYLEALRQRHPVAFYEEKLPALSHALGHGGEVR